MAKPKHEGDPDFVFVYPSEGRFADGWAEALVQGLQMQPVPLPWERQLSILRHYEHLVGNRLSSSDKDYLRRQIESLDELINPTPPG